MTVVPAVPIVQFSTSMYFCTETEGSMIIDVVRLGDATDQSTVDFSTVDGCAVAGVRYIAQSGTLVFDEEESTKQISIPIISDDKWDAELEFKVVLSSPTHATLGKSLSSCR